MIAPANNFYGQAKLVVRFENRAEWQKWRKYVLKTDWDFNDSEYPETTSMIIRFANSEDIEAITRKIVGLLQMGFNVYSCNWGIDQAEKQVYVQTRNGWKGLFS